MHNNIKIEIPTQVAYIMEQLEQKGFEAFIVGGCVRDSIIGRSPQDWDITTNAKPQDIKAAFDKTIDTGLQHGTVTVMIEGFAYEVTTYRTEGTYINNRKPEKVDFIDSIEEDLCRRDFTINAMAYNYTSGLIDPFNGLSDIKEKMVKAVGDAAQRFQEDALRMLRAIRFSAQLGYSIESDTLSAIKQKNALIKNISAERIRDELNKILMANPMAFELLHKAGLLEYVLPELDRCFDVEQQNPYHMYNIAIHSLHSASHIAKDLQLRWTMLLHDIGKADTISMDSKGINHFYGHEKFSAEKAEHIMRRLRFDSLSISRIMILILYHDMEPADGEKSIRKAISTIGVDLFDSWLQVKKADIEAQSSYKAAERIEKLEKVKIIYEKILIENQCLTIRDLAIDGNDLMTIGFKQGKELGRVLQIILEQVLEQPELNEKSTLLELAKKHLY